MVFLNLNISRLHSHEDSLSWPLYPMRTLFLDLSTPWGLSFLTSLPHEDSLSWPLYPMRTLFLDLSTPWGLSFLTSLPHEDSLSWPLYIHTVSSGKCLESWATTSWGVDTLCWWILRVDTGAFRAMRRCRLPGLPNSQLTATRLCRRHYRSVLVVSVCCSRVSRTLCMWWVKPSNKWLILMFLELQV